MTAPAAPKPAEINPLLKLALDLGPLLLFFFANARWGIFAATGAFMAATLVSIAVTYALARRVPMMPLVSAAVVMVFGGLTLYLQDEVFIKLKPTIIYALFAAVLLGGLAFGRSLLAVVLDSVFQLTDAGWKQLTVRWGVFFVMMAVLNEIVWRSVSTDAWVAFKTFGFLPLTIAFALAQTPLMMRHAADKKES
ncbi:MAG: septation protein A [Bradyrhizobiaceae bacterium]|nr:septation protein A [Bradyrhizobiaceae bacterium]